MEADQDTDLEPQEQVAELAAQLAAISEHNRQLARRAAAYM